MRRLPVGYLLALSGILAASLAAAADLAGVADRSYLDIVTIGRKSGEPRPTTIWFVAEGDVVFVQSGQGGKTNWYRNLEANPAVRLRFDGLEIEGRAVLIDDPAETERVHGLFTAKYWAARLSSWVGGGIGTGRVVRIEPVTSPRSESPREADGDEGASASPPGRPAE